MLSTLHRVLYADSRDLDVLQDLSVDLVVTSPPYPMIEMWDTVFDRLDHSIGEALRDLDGRLAFELMHRELDKVWRHVFRVLKPGGWVCINIGDATRKIGHRFQLFSNHSRITSALCDLGLDCLPVILWRKQTNAPNKFMGSGMLPAGAYVTLEHEYILVFRKGEKRSFGSLDAARNRQMSSFFWEERNVWFSDIWDFKGIRQPLNHRGVRDRSAAFPFELAYRLVNMYSVVDDVVLDPFLGTGTTCFAALASRRNSVGVEIDASFDSLIGAGMDNAGAVANQCVARRLNEHLRFIQAHEEAGGVARHRNVNYGFPVVTSQEARLALNYVTSVVHNPEEGYRAFYDERYRVEGEPASRPACEREQKGETT